MAIFNSYVKLPESMSARMFLKHVCIQCVQHINMHTHNHMYVYRYRYIPWWGVVPAGDFANQSDSTKEWRVYQKWLGKGGFLSSGKPGIYWSKHKNTHVIIEKAGKPPDDRPSTLGILSFNEGQTIIKYRELKNDAAERWFHFLLPPGIKHGNGKCTLIIIVCWIFH